MYVERLIEFATKNEGKLPPPGYKKKRIQWVIDIENDSLTFSPLKNREFFVPDIGRSSNIRPILLADKPDYIFGMFEKEKDKERSKERQAAFIDLLEEYVEDEKDQDVQLLINHLKKDIKVPKSMRISDFVIFRIRDEEFLHEKESVKKFWDRHIRRSIDNEKTNFICMFCHKPRPIMKRHTIDFTVGRDRTKMISANKNAYESHGLKKSQIAPTCFSCEQRYGKALEYLLLRHKNRKRSGGPHMFFINDLTYVYWLRDEQQLSKSLTAILSPTEQKSTQDMYDLLNQTFRGVVVKRDVNNFCLLTLSSNKGRLVVRDYIEDSAGKVKDRIKLFFDAQNIGQKHFYGIYTLASTMYVEPSNQMQKYAVQEWIEWLLYNRRLSGKILIPILRRIQATGSMYPQQGAAIKSWLVSQGKERKWTVTIDLENKNKAYLTGRLFAILERIQERATNAEGTIAGKFFGSASTTPRSVMGLLIRNSQHHLNKLRNSPNTRATAIYLEKELGLVLSHLDAFPQTLFLEQQAEFALGYYHQRQALFQPKNQKKEVDKNDS